MAEKDVDYSLEIVDDLPELAVGRHSPLEDQIDRVVNEERCYGKYVRIGSYGNSGAASAAASTLRRKYGDKPSVGGFEIRVRRADKDGQPRTGVFVRYDPTVIVEGEREAFKERIKAKEQAKQARKTERATAASA